MQSPSETAMADRQFWVIGGEFQDTEGPFESYDEAFEIWQARSNANRSEAPVRYTIAANPAR